MFSSPVNIKLSSGTFPTPEDLPLSLAGLKPTSTRLTLVTLGVNTSQRVLGSDNAILVVLYSHTYQILKPHLAHQVKLYKDH